MRLLVEPISAQAFPGYFMSHPNLALRALDEIGPNACLLFDVYHSKLCGVDPFDFLRRELDRIGHVHIADEPGRHEPGTVTLDFSAIFNLLDESSFGGFVGCEYVPAGRTEDGLGWLAAANATSGFDARN